MNSGVIVIGAGGHAKVCIELLRAMNQVVSYCVGGLDSDAQCLDVPVLKGDSHLSGLRERGYSRALVAIGDNKLRARLSNAVLDMGFEIISAISPGAVVSPSAAIGRGTVVMAGAVINADAVIGDFSIVNTGACVDHDCNVGMSVHLGPQTALAGAVEVGDYSFLGVGSKAIPEVRIGKDVVVGAGAVVVSNILDEVTVVGIPARIK